MTLHHIDLVFCVIFGVIGGSLQCGDTTIEQYPYQLSLRVNNVHRCTAALYSLNKAVTVAHCGGSSISTYSILAGSSNKDDVSCSTCQLRPLYSFTSHPDFNNSESSGYPNDIAVLSFQVLEMTSSVRPIELDDRYSGECSGTQCMLTGWGTSVNPSTLKWNSVSTMSNTACSYYMDDFQLQIIRSSNVCVSVAHVCDSYLEGLTTMVCDGKLVGLGLYGSWTAYVLNRISYFRNFIDGN